MKKFVLILTFFLVAIWSAPATAAQIELWDYEFYVDGGMYYYGDAVPNLDDSAFDWGTGIGTLALEFDPGAGDNYAVDAWFDHEIYNDDRDGSFADESAAVFGSVDTDNGQFGVDYSGDASMWIGYDDIDLAANEYAVIEFIISQSVPSGFYIRHLQEAYTNGDFVQDEALLYLSSTVDIRTRGTEPVPEPGTLLLFGIGILGLAKFSRKRAA